MDIKAYVGSLIDLYVQGNIVSNISKQCCWFSFFFLIYFYLKKAKVRPTVHIVWYEVKKFGI